MKTFKLEGKSREIIARSADQKRALKAMRKNDEIPAVLYGGEKVVHFAVTNDAVRKLVYTPEIFAVELTIDGETTMAIMKGYLPDDWDAIIKPVNKASSTGGSSSSGTETVSDNCFLLAEIEIFGSTKQSVSGEGTQYAYYKAGNSKVKNKVGSASIWWERSHRSGKSGYFCSVSSTGNASANYANKSEGVAFAFCV